MDGDVETHELPELRVSEAELVSEVSSVIKGSITVWQSSEISILFLVDDSSNARDLGAEINAVFKSRFPVLGLVDTTLVSTHEVGRWLASEHSHGQLGHGVHILREGLDHGLLLSRESTSAEKFLLEASNFRLCGDLTGQEKPQDTLRNGLTPWNLGWSIIADVKELGASVSDTFHSIELGGLIEHTWDSTHATHDLGNSDFANDSVSVLLAEGNDFLLAFSDDSLHLFAEDGGGESALRSKGHRALGLGGSLEESVHSCKYL